MEMVTGNRIGEEGDDDDDGAAMVSGWGPI